MASDGASWSEDVDFRTHTITVRLSSGIGVDSRNVYWVDPNGNVDSVPTDDGAVATIASGQNGPTCLAVGATNVFWADFNGGGEDAGTIMTAPK